MLRADAIIWLELIIELAARAGAAATTAATTANASAASRRIWVSSLVL
jgi:hypothetical protein